MIVAPGDSVAAWREEVSRAGLRSTEVAVANAMANGWDRRTGTTRLGVVVLARKAGCSVRTVCRVMKRLRDTGLIVQVDRHDRVRRRADVYALACVASNPRRREQPRAMPKRPASSLHATVAHQHKNTTPGRSARVAAAVARHPVGVLEAKMITARAVGMIDRGTPEKVILAAIVHDLPEGTRSAPSLIHARLANVEGLGEREGLGWVSRLGVRRRWKAHGAPRRRAVAEHGETTQEMARW